MNNFTLFENFDYSVFDDPDYKEDAVREDIITPLLRQLGYQNVEPYKIIRTKQLKHPFVYIGSTSNKITITPDYQLSLDRKIKCVIEVKSPQVKISDKQALQQAYNYAIHPEIRAKYYAICNGRYLEIFDVDKISSVFFHEIKQLSDPAIWKKLYNRPLAKVVKSTDTRGYEL
ncbi:MAG: hypothetical protein E6Q83_01585 [Thiothrix sp.]|nr:MAG: hypothetical protein E6Q83_01585 [Thiothrix sp.]